ncbi:MAG: diguanylate cyclase [Desulfarculaceae bacterium]|nr:diguanylate cyclase [Desulfarculaceae bacterium]MCF8070872.1 diguanylate cyclase [Desulfarculaceae bacterium]MCF8100460.1 diguanylate cyclase [Desulfarculaceae bacterium]MCF8117954.1 diguanylate cyclase [Desulfarculaceae bacterium]
MPRALDQHSRRPSVGAKLAAVLVVVVFGSTLLLAAAQYWMASGVMREHFREQAEVHLHHTLRLMETTSKGQMSPAELLAEVRGDASLRNLARRGFRIFGLDNQGKVVLRPRDPGALLPPREIRGHMASSAWGVVSFRQQGEPVLVAYDRVPSGELIVGVSATPSLPPGPLGLPVWAASILFAAVVALLAALATILWLHFSLSRPLRRLTAEAEQAAAGELTPPDPLERGDELGRLSLALNHLTESARDMVARARDEQARFLRLFNDTKDGVFIAGPDGILSDVNPALMEMFGFRARDQLVGGQNTQPFFAHHEERQLYIDSLWAQGYVQDFPATMLRKDGSEFEALITSTRTSEGEGRFGILRDVTQMRADQLALGESEARYRRLVENAPDIIYRWSITGGHFDYVSSAVRDITGYAPARLLSGEMNLDSFLHPEHRSRVRAYWRRLLHSAPGELCKEEFAIITASGQTRWLRDKAMVVRDEVGRPLLMEGIATDITERKLLEQEQKRGRQMVESTLQGLPAAVMVIDDQHRVVHWNRAMEGLTGVPAEKMVGTNNQWQPFYLEPQPVLADLILDAEPGKIMQRYAGLDLKRSSLAEGGVEGESFFATLGADGRHLYFLAAPIRDAAGKITHAVETLVDLSDKVRLERELRRLSVTDSLTGLYNQRFFYATLRREIEAAARYGQPLSLLMADIDFFKAYNDRFGHLAGDKALRQFAETLGSCVRAMDLCCRYGGEEFAVLLPHATMNEALMVAERVRSGVSQTPFAPEDSGLEVQLTVSLGAATLGPGEQEEDLVRRADGALYAAKQAGRDSVAAELRQGGVRVMARGAADLSGRGDASA